MTKKIFFLRHATSVYNKHEIDVINCQLSKDGVEEAKKLSGHYNLVIVSPMRRALETLKYSKITYDKIIVSYLIREQKKLKCDFLNGEKLIKETKNQVLERTNIFKSELKILKKIYDSILVITHANFAWYFTSDVIDGTRFGIWLKNTEMVEIKIED